MPRALVRRPSPRLSEGIVSHIQRRPVDVELAYLQWDGYVDALRTHGWAPIEVDEAPDCPDGVFVEDTMVIFDDLAVIARSGARARRAELAGAERAIVDSGYRIERIDEPGTLDGGDVLKIGSHLYVGRGGRTNDAGIEQLRDLVAPAGATVTPVDVGKVLHLKSAVTALPDGTVIGHPPLVDDPTVFERFLAVTEDREPMSSYSTTSTS